MSRIRAINYTCILYPDDSTHVEAMYRLQSNGYSFIGILHEFDHESDDINKPLKKPHYHFIVCFTRQKDLNPLAAELGIAPQYLEPCRNKEGAIKYLVHANNPEKYQYLPESLFGTLKPQALAILESGTSQEEKVLNLLFLLDTLPKPCSYRKFLTACCEANLYAQFRHLGFGVKLLLDEHNGIGYIDFEERS